MASTGTYITYDGNRKQNKETIVDILTDLAPKETPLLSGLQKTKATGVFHEFAQHALSRPTSVTPYIEGDDITRNRMDSPTRNINFVEKVVEDFTVSDEQDIVSKVGPVSEYARRKARAMATFKMKMERELIWGSGNSGASATGRIMKGFLTVISTNATNASGTSLTEAKFNDYLEMLYYSIEDGSLEAYLDMALKRTVSSFTAGVTKNVDMDDKRLSNQIDVYQSDVAKSVKLFGHQDLRGSNSMFIIRPSAYKFATLEAPFTRDMPAAGLYKSGVAAGSGTLEFNYEQAGAKITNIVSGR